MLVKSRWEKRFSFKFEFIFDFCLPNGNHFVHLPSNVDDFFQSEKNWKQYKRTIICKRWSKEKKKYGLLKKNETFLYIPQATDHQTTFIHMFLSFKFEYLKKWQQNVIKVNLY
jgi:hypothetical protein